MSSIHSRFEGLDIKRPESESEPGSDAGTRCRILELPDELLLEIVSATAALWPQDIDGTEFHALYAERWALTLVCRRFNRLATPTLYSNIALTLGDIMTRKFRQADGWKVEKLAQAGFYRRLPSGRAALLLRRSMEANPSLRQYCRDLVFDMEDPRWQEYSHLDCGTDFVEWFTNTESLRFHDGFDLKQMATTLMFMGVASMHMPRLKRLALTSRHRLFNMAGLFDPVMQRHILQFPELKELQLAGMARHGNPPSSRVEVRQ